MCIRDREKGILIILASARIFQGVLPLAYQIEMDKYGGYILSSNGTYAYDMKHKKMLFCEEIQKEDALETVSYTHLHWQCTPSGLVLRLEPSGWSIL